jgi:cell wall-associated NlpC family hydrolase
LSADRTSHDQKSLSCTNVRPVGRTRVTLVAAAVAALSLVSFSVTAVTASAAPAARVSRAMPRMVALKWAERQAGKWYCWGGTGPTCYDCSGLVAAAYRQAGISLPASTYAMLDDPRLKLIPARDRRPGDLAFFGTGHVELVTANGTFGAADTGSQVGWHQPNDWWYPTMYYAVVK